MLRLIVTHSVLPINAEKRYSPDITVGSLKNKLEIIVGTAPGNQILQSKTADGDMLCTLQPDTAKLGSFGMKNFGNLHVVDTNPEGGIVAAINAYNTGKVEAPEYKISDEAYAKRDDSFSKWKQQNLKQFYGDKADKQKSEEERWESDAQKIKVGERCQIGAEKLKHRGTVKFVGKTESSRGMWVGVELDEPFGNSNGTKKNKEYFSCSNKYGTFIRPDSVEVGDFPAIDEFDVSDDDDTEL